MSTADPGSFLQWLGGHCLPQRRVFHRHADTGLIHYSTTEMDRTVEDVLDNYGEAIRSTENVPNSSLNLALLAFGFGSDIPDLASPNPGYSFRRKQSIDFAKSAFNSLTYSQVLLV